MPPAPNLLTQMQSIRDRDGVRALLLFLNDRSPHRFTALYRFDDATLKNLYFIDREQPGVESCPDIPLLASYCVFVRDTNHTFVTPDAANDDRTTGHPKRLVVRSYCGVPLVNEQGRAFGTICHFDFQPLPFTDATIDLMEAVAPLLEHEGR